MFSIPILLQQLINGLMLGIMDALIAVGFTLFFGVLDVIHFAHGDIFMLGAFSALAFSALAASLGIPEGGGMFFFVALGAIPFTGLLGILVERICIKPLRHSPPLIVLLATMALGVSLRMAVMLFYPRGADPKRFPNLFPSGYLEVGEVVIRYDNMLIFAIGLLVIVATNLLITRTKLGMAIRAVAQDAEAAMMMGVDMDRTVDFTFFLGSVLAAVAGILHGLYYSEVMFTMGLMGGIAGFSSAVIGGLGNIYGAIVGGFLFGLLQTFASAFLPKGAEFKEVFVFTVVILFLAFKPTGLLGEKVSERV